MEIKLWLLHIFFFMLYDAVKPRWSSANSHKISKSLSSLKKFSAHNLINPIANQLFLLIAYCTYTKSEILIWPNKVQPHHNELDQKFNVSIFSQLNQYSRLGKGFTPDPINYIKVSNQFPFKQKFNQRWGNQLTIRTTVLQTQVNT